MRRKGQYSHKLSAKEESQMSAAPALAPGTTSQFQPNALPGGHAAAGHAAALPEAHPLLPIAPLQPRLLTNSPVYLRDPQGPGSLHKAAAPREQPAPRALLR